jgi:hypothetical protein
VPDPSALQKLEDLQGRLQSRESIVHFSHCGASLLAAIIFAGASGKLFWDSNRFPWLAWLAAALTLFLVTYSVRRYWKGQRALASELKEFEDLKALRRTLSLDDPSALLPRQ